MAYRIEFSAGARRAFDKLSASVRKRLAETLDALAEEPRPHGSTKLSGSDLHRVRCGDYRVIYQIQDARLLVLVVKIGHRREVYR